ncbi:MAG: thioredoxin family protein [Candidatus Shikimatogenerans sp. Tmey]
MKNINKKKLSKYLKKKKLLLVDFWAKWCYPCKKMNNILKKLDLKFKNKKIKILKINIDKNIDLSDKYDIQTIPTIFFFKKKKIIKTIIGTVSYKYLKKKIKNFL